MSNIKDDLQIVMFRGTTCAYQDRTNQSIVGHGEHMKTESF